MTGPMRGPRGGEKEDRAKPYISQSLLLALISMSLFLTFCTLFCRVGLRIYGDVSRRCQFMGFFMVNIAEWKSPVLADSGADWCRLQLVEAGLRCCRAVIPCPRCDRDFVVDVSHVDAVAPCEVEGV